jgi:hypothetical protein
MSRSLSPQICGFYLHPDIPEKFGIFLSPGYSQLIHKRSLSRIFDTNQYNHTFISEVIKKCRNALAKLESGEFGKRQALLALFKDCRRQLDECKQLIDQRNELIHALWFPQAFQPGSVTRLWVPRPKPGEVSEIKTQEHNVSELRVTALEIRNLVYPLDAVTVKLRVAFQQPTA